MHDDFMEIYRQLGVKPGTSFDGIRAAYRLKVSTCHPDRFQTDIIKRQIAEEETKAINNAYQILTEYYRRTGKFPLGNDFSMRQEIFNAGKSNGEGEERQVPNTSNDMPAKASRSYGYFIAVLIASVIAIYFVVNSTDAENEPPETSMHKQPGSQLVDIGAPGIQSTDSSSNSSLIEIGSTLGEVYAIQGIPTKEEKDVWYYGNSRIHFLDGVVTQWDEELESPLKIRRYRDPSDEVLIVPGTTKAEVRKIQGNPTVETASIWSYGRSQIFFVGDRVVNWREFPLEPLKVRN